ncbi:hypothetical protein B0H19DRAFT_1145631 [Mycena capillaripes]|nr:hypothetical protein B0H19DRAFT_1145631 [Mycena capillaripes]
MRPQRAGLRSQRPRYAPGFTFFVCPHRLTARAAVGFRKHSCLRQRQAKLANRVHVGLVSQCTACAHSLFSRSCVPELSGELRPSRSCMLTPSIWFMQSRSCAQCHDLSAVFSAVWRDAACPKTPNSRDPCALQHKYLRRMPRHSICTEHLLLLPSSPHWGPKRPRCCCSTPVPQARDDASASLLLPPSDDRANKPGTTAKMRQPRRREKKRMQNSRRMGTKDRKKT